MPEEIKDTRWDENNKPQNYILGASPGFAAYGQGREKLTNMGLARKIIKACRMGFNFGMIDYEALSEMYEADLKEQITRVKEEQGIEVGLHLPVKIDLCISNANEWKIMHEILQKGAYSAKELVGAKFYLFHTSSRIRPHVTFKIGHQEPRVQQVSYDGVNLGRFMDDFDAGKYTDPKRGKVHCPSATPDGKKFLGMRDWFMARFINVLYNVMGAAGDVGMITYFDEHPLKSFKIGKEEAYKKFEDVWSKIDDLADKTIIPELLPLKNRLRELEEELARDPLKKGLYENEMNILNGRIYRLSSDEYKEKVRRNILDKNDELNKEYKKYAKVRSYTESYDFYKVYSFWTRKGSECEEQVAYRVIAKYMWITGDPLWTDIVGSKYDPDEITDAADKDEKYYPGTKKETDTLIKKMITAVACKYIEGHLFVKDPMWSMKALKDTKLEQDISAYEYTKNAKIQIYIETAMPPEGQEGELRIMSAVDHVKLAKHLDGGKFVSYCLDFEHLTVNFIRVEDDIKELGEDEAKYITMVHINAPRPIMGAHAPLDVLSYDMYIIYRWLYWMRQKGMKNTYMIWEMGSYGADQSAVAFRNLIEELKKGTHFDKLPIEVYGLDRGFEARQVVAMKEHALDPLKGLITMPEEEHGILSKAAVEKGKAAEWRKGRFK